MARRLHLLHFYVLCGTVWSQAHIRLLARVVLHAYTKAGVDQVLFFLPFVQMNFRTEELV